MLRNLGQTPTSRAMITAVLCVLLYSYRISRKWVLQDGLFPDKIVYPEDANYVEPTKPPSNDSPRFVLNFTEFSPKIVWLMSFPNSGTSFTMNNIRKVTNRSIATNYADEVTVKGQRSLPIYPFHDEGPFWTGLKKSDIVSKIRELPKDYVLTKTHCGSRCGDCGPLRYTSESAQGFLFNCTRGHARLPDEKKKMRRTTVHYPVNRVRKAIHLIRNPFNNLVSRFHLVQHDKIRKNRTEFLTRIPNNAKGFQTWCQDLDSTFAQEDKQVFGKDPDLYKAVTSVHCHGELYTYVLWHNFAFELENLLEIPVHVLFYEDYEKDFNGTVAKMLDFLETKQEGEPIEFHAGHVYDDFFSKEQRVAIKTLIKRIASPKTWQHVERYL